MVGNTDSTGFVVAAMWGDGNETAIVVGGQLPVVEPVVPLGGIVPVNHVAGEGHEKRLQFPDHGVGGLANIAVIPRIPAGDEAEGFRGVGSGVEVETTADSVFIRETNEVRGVRAQVSKGHHAVFHSVEIDHFVDLLFAGVLGGFSIVVFGAVMKSGWITLELVPDEGGCRRRVFKPNKAVFFGL